MEEAPAAEPTKVEKSKSIVEAAAVSDDANSQSDADEPHDKPATDEPKTETSDGDKTEGHATSDVVSQDAGLVETKAT